MANRREVLKKIDLTGDTVIITGSTGGLGFELAEQYIKAGSNLILIAKDNKKLERQIDYLNGIKKTNQCDNLVNIRIQKGNNASTMQKQITAFHPLF